MGTEKENTVYREGTTFSCDSRADLVHDMGFSVTEITS